MTTAVSPIRIVLRELREKAGLTQVQLAEKAQVRQATVSAIELGTRRIDLDVLERLCAALDVSPAAMFALEPKGKKRR
jgi:transcriptional regulator with XRE-family HTH domain